MNKLFEKQLSSKEIYNGRVFKVTCDNVELSDGYKSEREIVHHSGGVVIVAEKGNNILFVKQYRYATKEVLYELPAGKLDSKDEDPNSAVRRELREETGLSCKKLTYIGQMYGSPAILDEVIHMYIAEDLTKGECDFDEDEIIETVYIPLDEMFDMIMRGEIRDSKTQIAVLKAYNIIKGIHPSR